MSILDVQRLFVQYSMIRGGVEAVSDVSLQLREGETIGLVGQSGCGKSTLGLSLLRILPPPGRIVSGHILYKDTDITARMIHWENRTATCTSTLSCFIPTGTIQTYIIVTFRSETHQRPSQAKSFIRFNDMQVDLGVVCAYARTRMQIFLSAIQHLIQGIGSRTAYYAEQSDYEA